MLLIYEKNWIQTSLLTFEVNITNLLVLKVKDYESNMLSLSIINRNKEKENENKGRRLIWRTDQMNTDNDKTWTRDIKK